MQTIYEACSELRPLDNTICFLWHKSTDLCDFLIKEVKSSPC